MILISRIEPFAFDFIEKMYSKYEQESIITIYTLITLFFSIRIYKNLKRRFLKETNEFVYYTESDYGVIAFFYSLGGISLIASSVWYSAENELPQMLKFIFLIGCFSTVNAIIFHPYNKFKIENFEIVSKAYKESLKLKLASITQIEISDEKIVFKDSENELKSLKNLGLSNKWKNRIYDYFKTNSYNTEITIA